MTSSHGRGADAAAIDFRVERIDDVAVFGPDALLRCDLMSPYVWQEPGDSGFHLLLRAVPADGASDRHSGCIWYGRSGSDGALFRMAEAPAIACGGEALDARGCEDPTVVRTADGYVVLYTGVDADGVGHMLYATGPDMASLSKRGIALRNSKTERNSKEAAVMRDGAGWRLLYEYAHDGHSLIGLAEGAGPGDPWTHRGDPFTIRPGQWDGYHLSTGPLLVDDPACPIMFYNGANADADWGIGWVALAPDLSSAVARGEAPLIAPPADVDGPRDIAFAASAVEREGRIWLYYSRNDRELRRATVRRRR